MARIATGCSPDPRLRSGAHRRGHHGDVAKAGLEWPRPCLLAGPREAARPPHTARRRPSPQSTWAPMRPGAAPAARCLALGCRSAANDNRGRVFRPGRGCRIHQRRTITGSLSRPCRSYRVGRWHRRCRRWCRCPRSRRYRAPWPSPQTPEWLPLPPDPAMAAGTGTDGGTGADATVAAVRYRQA
jgi:hypothetical protein